MKIRHNPIVNMLCSQEQPSLLSTLQIVLTSGLAVLSGKKEVGECLIRCDCTLLILFVQLVP